MTDTSTGKIHIVTKVHDENCDICKHMSKHDRATFESYPSIGYQEILLDTVLQCCGDLTERRIYELLERHCLSPTYEVDLPVYLMMDKKGKYLGHIQGAATISEIRDKIAECLEDTPE